MSRILICSPVKLGNPALTEAFMRIIPPMLQGNPDHEIGLFLDCTPVKGVESVTPWSKVAVARNRMLDATDFNEWDYLLWIDADIIDCPADMPTTLLAANPRGVTAPLVLIEGTNNAYDWAANILLGQSHIEPENRWNLVGRNIQNAYPYWPDESYLSQERIPMDCTGTITLVPSWIYQSGARYFDHPAFTDHFPICSRCKLGGMNVIVVPSCVAHHADLEKFGEKWH